MSSRSAEHAGARVRVAVESPILDTPRVKQVAAMFDVPPSDRARLSWDVPLPLDEQPWNVGLIVGPSGAGKTTIAAARWPHMRSGYGWRPDRALVDDFPEAMSIREVTGLLSAVGLASPPAWLRPHATLSNGEQFRADMARVLAEHDAEHAVAEHDAAGGGGGPGIEPVVVDEFTSVVDRQVAQVASHALQKTIRRGGRRFVAVTCHYDVADWLQPDWVLDVAAGDFAWRSVQPHPQLELCIGRVDRSAWRMFSRHHYLSAELHTGARCYGGWLNGKLAVFAAYRHFPHAHVRNLKMSHRVVVLPDFQGLGLAGRVTDWLGQQLHEQRQRFRETTAHPARIAYFRRSPRWRDVTAKRSLKQGRTATASLRRQQSDPRRLNTRTYEYTAPHTSL